MRVDRLPPSEEVDACERDREAEATLRALAFGIVAVMVLVVLFVVLVFVA